MRRKAAQILVLSLLVVPCVGAQSGPCVEPPPITPGTELPFGFFDGNPEGKTSASGLFSLLGWALADSGVLRVDVVVDGAVVAPTDYGRRRGDVAKLFPGYPDSNGAGFGVLLDTSQFLNGLHAVTVQVTTVTGEVRLLNTINLDFKNNTHNLRPFGAIDFPLPNAELFGNCDLTDLVNRRYSVITGWVLDAGVENNDHGVAYVELLINGGLYANSRLSCRHSLATGAFTDCYGLRRQDIERIFPTLKNAPNAGFRFVLDVGLLIAPIVEGGIGYRPGHHVLTIRSGDIDSQVSNVASIDVTFACDDFFANEGSFGQIGSPGEGDQRTGIIEVTGWALDREGVDKVFVFVDGRFQAAATRRIPKPDITALHPGFPDSHLPGWAFGLNTILFSDGEHVIDVVVRDRTGDDTLIGQRRFVANNGTP